MCDNVNQQIGRINPADKKGQTYLNNVPEKIAYDRTTGKAYFFITAETGVFKGDKAVIDEKKTYKIMEVADGVITEVFSFQEAGRHSPKMYYDAPTKTILSVKYAETGKTGTANLIDLETKSIRQIETPLLAYCAVFDPDKTRLYLLSNKTGKIWVVNRQTGRLMNQFDAGRLGFRIGLVQKDMLAFFNAQGVKIFSTKDRYKLVSNIAAKKYLGGTKPDTWPQGGVIENGEIYIGLKEFIYNVKYK
ncbi:MAG: YncE family protein [Spirochaetota bacterium]